MLVATHTSASSGVLFFSVSLPSGSRASTEGLQVTYREERLGVRIHSSRPEELGESKSIHCLTPEDDEDHLTR